MKINIPIDIEMDRIPTTALQQELLRRECTDFYINNDEPEYCIHMVNTSDLIDVLSRRNVYCCTVPPLTKEQITILCETIRSQNTIQIGSTLYFALEKLELMI